jgi:hypothetical protein
MQAAHGVSATPRSRAGTIDVRLIAGLLGLFLLLIL